MAGDCPLPVLYERQLTGKLPLRIAIREAIADPQRTPKYFRHRLAEVKDLAIGIC